MARHLLNETSIRNAKPKGRPYRLRDGDGLYLFVSSLGARSWQLRYRHDGKEQVATLGKLTTVQGLAWARAEADVARGKAEAGEHLTRAKVAAKAQRAAAAGATFAQVAAAWLKSEAKRANWTPDYVQEVTASIGNHLSALDALPMTEITAPIAAPILRRAERKAPDMATKVRQRLRAIFDYAVEDGVVPLNPIPPARRAKAERKHYPAVLDHAGVGAILRAADKADVARGVRRAHLLAAFTAQRIGEIVPATWAEVDLQAGTWSIPRERMKRKDEKRGPHVVPIPPVLLGQVREWRRADGDEAMHVCPAPRGDGHITREAVEKFYRRALDLGGKHSPHSWRSLLNSWAGDAGKDMLAVEAQLDHVVGNKVTAAYDRAQRLDLRRDLMRWHEGRLIAARDGADVVPINRVTR